MKDLSSAKAIWFKAVLFLLIALTSTTLLLLDMHSLKNTLLLGMTVWAFCRAYYFAFYVLERYVDPRFRFSGLGSLFCYLFKRWNHKN